MKAVLLVFVILLQAVLGLDSRWKLIWGDDFNGNSLDTTHWTAEHTTLVYNNEKQWYSSAQVYVANGNLILKSNPDSTYPSQPYASGKVVTENKFLVTYGRVEVYGKLPYGQGIWPAYWLLASCTNYAEVDIMELVGNDMNTIYSTYHYNPNCVNSATLTSIGDGISGPDFSQDYHLYAVEMNSSSFTFYVDNSVVLTVTSGLWYYAQTPHYIILNTAVGGNWPGSPDSSTVFPQYHYIDYVRVYGWQPCVTGCGAHGCCNAAQTCTCDSNYVGTNCEYQIAASGTTANCDGSTSPPTSSPPTSPPGVYIGTPIVSPNAISPGGSATISFSVTISGSSFPGFILYGVYPSNDGSNSNEIVKWSTSFTYTPGTHSFSYSFTIPSSTSAGSYKTVVGVYDSNWNNLAWNDPASIFSVCTAGVTITNNAASPSTVSPGQSLTISFIVNTCGGVSGFAGASVVPHNNWDNSGSIAQPQTQVNLASGANPLSYTVTIPWGTAAGSYRVTMGVWASNWDNLAFLNSGAVITVS